MRNCTEYRFDLPRRQMIDLVCVHPLFTVFATVSTRSLPCVACVTAFHGDMVVPWKVNKGLMAKISIDRDASLLLVRLYFISYLYLILVMKVSFSFHSFSDSFIIMQQDWIFWSLFTILTISIAMAYMVLCSGSPVIITSIFTSFMVVLPIDYYTGSTLKYIIINAVRRATVKDFRLAAIQHPVQTWGIVSLYSISYFFTAIETIRSSIHRGTSYLFR